MLNALGDVLHPYSEAIAAFAGTVTCLQFLAGIFFLNDIRNKGSADGFSVAPLLGGIVLSVLSLKYGNLVKDNTMINVNFIGFVINVIFMMVFYAYSSSAKRRTIWGNIVAASIFISACFSYAKWEDPELIEFRFGMLITTILVLLVGSPLLQIGEIVRNKSTESLPFPLIVAGTIVASSWMLYGISIKNSILLYQNGFLLLLSSIQLSLFVIYPRKGSKVSSKKQTKDAKSKKAD